MVGKLNRRGFLAGAGAAAAWRLAEGASAADAKIGMKTFTYKTVGDLEIKADVHRADDDKPRKVVVWIHGGALIMGHREGISDRVKNGP
jgi:acetyl esterase/lipase